MICIGLVLNLGPRHAIQVCLQSFDLSCCSLLPGDVWLRNSATWRRRMPFDRRVLRGELHQPDSLTAQFAVYLVLTGSPNQASSFSWHMRYCTSVPVYSKILSSATAIWFGQRYNCMCFFTKYGLCKWWVVALCKIR